MRPVMQTKIRQIMQEKVITISSEDRLSTAQDIMRLGRVRHMPVVRGGKLVGIVSERDLLRVSLSSLSHKPETCRAFLEDVTIAEVMSTPPIVIDPEASTREAAGLMAEDKIGCLPVMRGGRLLGLVTQTDLLRFFGANDLLGNSNRPS